MTSKQPPADAETRELPSAKASGDQGLRECPYCKVDESQIDSVRHYNEAQEKYFHYVDCNSCEMTGPTKDTEQEAIEAWNNLPRPPCSPVWIPVSERLPEKSGAYFTSLFRSDGRSVALNRFNKDESPPWIYNGVEAWMEGPKPYVPTQSPMSPETSVKGDEQEGGGDEK